VARTPQELLGEADELARRAIEEFRKGVSERDELAVRDAAEKAWNAVVQATNALILSLLGELPTSHFERRKMLRELEKRFDEVAKAGILDRYMARYRVLHGETFYEGIIDVEMLEAEFEKVVKYIEDVRAILASRTRS